MKAGGWGWLAMWCRACRTRTRSRREPHIGTDTLTTATASDHVVLQRGPRFYRIKVKEGDRAVPVTAIEAQVRAVLADSKGATYAAEPPVGALTAWHRDQWSDARDALRLNPVNAASLAAIDSSLFIVTLDDSKPTSHEDLSRAMLHGDARNRWYDKCLNLIVCANGKAGINWEHAWGDGVAVLYFFNEVSWKEGGGGGGRPPLQSCTTISHPNTPAGAQGRVSDGHPRSHTRGAGCQRGAPAFRHLRSHRLLRHCGRGGVQRQCHRRD